MPDSDNKLFGLLGHPLRHSLSPHLHRFLLREIQQSGCYHAFEIGEGKLEAAIEGMKTLGFTGFNVTVPYKERIMTQLDEISSEAQRIGAVNTVHIENNRLLGYNTDAAGFTFALQRKNIHLAKRVATVLGAGGAARAVTSVLIQGGVQKIYLHNRTLLRAERLVTQLRDSTGFKKFVIREWSEPAITESSMASTLIVNTTSVGMWPKVQAVPFCFPADAKDVTAVDLVYNPLETRFLRSAISSGAQIVDGLDMFILQGIEAMRIWTGKHFNVNLNQLRAWLVNKIEEYGQN